MSSTPAPSAPGPRGSQSTRQLLDELDALMQRMLALPVDQDEAGDSEDSPVPVSTLAPAVRPPEPTAAAGALAPPRDEPDMPPPARAGVVSYRTTVPEEDEPENETPVHRPAAAPPPAEASLPARPVPPAPFNVFASLRTTAPSPGIRADPPHRRPARTGMRPIRIPWLAPIHWINRVFDRGTERLGAPGRWLRGRTGRSTLGWLGVALLAVALGWAVLAWIGWTW